MEIYVIDFPESSKIQAIKLYRDYTHCDLKTAKDAIELIQYKRASNLLLCTTDDQLEIEEIIHRADEFHITIDLVGIDLSSASGFAEWYEARLKTYSSPLDLAALSYFKELFLVCYDQGRRDALADLMV